MRRQGSGWVVQFSSVGGQFTAPGFGAYCATKFALEGLTQTLSEEVPHVRFLIVEPGAFRTGLFGKDAKPPLRLVLGGDAIDRIRQRLGHLQDELTEWEELGRDTALDE
jgi:NAD(P)-dependent dehydrogenase (short-subunit alcohol dehydrogenase family)